MASIHRVFLAATLFLGMIPAKADTLLPKPASLPSSTRQFSPATSKKIKDRGDYYCSKAVDAVKDLSGSEFEAQAKAEFNVSRSLCSHPLGFTGHLEPDLNQKLILDEASLRDGLQYLDSLLALAEIPSQTLSAERLFAQQGYQPFRQEAATVYEGLATEELLNQSFVDLNGWVVQKNQWIREHDFTDILLAKDFHRFDTIAPNALGICERLSNNSVELTSADLGQSITALWLRVFSLHGEESLQTVNILGSTSKTLGAIQITFLADSTVVADLLAAWSQTPKKKAFKVSTSAACVTPDTKLVSDLNVTLH